MTPINQSNFSEEIDRETRQKMLRMIASFEAMKGIAALAALIGLVDLTHHDVRHLVLELIGHFGLNPHDHYPSIMLHYAELLPGVDMQTLVLIASCYIGTRFIESYGLWNDLIWGEWLGALSGAAYIPFEIFHLTHTVSIINAVVLSCNIFIVAFLAIRLWQKRRIS